MSEIHDYISNYSKTVTENQPSTDDRWVNLHFFNVRLDTFKFQSTTAEEFIRVAKAHVGSFVEKLDLFDGEEHNFIELGAWIGDQGAAMRFMGMGVLLGVLDLLTPETVMPFLPKALKDEMAGKGMVAVKSKKKKVDPAVDHYQVRIYRMLRIEEEAFIDIKVPAGSSKEQVEEIAKGTSISDNKWQRKGTEILDVHFCDSVKL
jgi:hypothetical protein